MITKEALKKALVTLIANIVFASGINFGFFLLLTMTLKFILGMEDIEISYDFLVMLSRFSLFLGFWIGILLSIPSGDKS